MHELPPPSSRWSSFAAWLMIVGVFATAVGVWGNTLIGVLDPRAASAATPERGLAERLLFEAPTSTARPVGSQPDCLYGQSTEGMLVVMSAKTGSLLSPAQAANCTK